MSENPPLAGTSRRRTRFSWNGWELVDYREGFGELTFVIVHGIGVASRYSRPLAAKLAEHGVVHTVEMPGFGAAAEPRESMSISDFAALLAAWLQDRGLLNAVLIGHSMGAQVVLEIAWQHPELTGHLALMGPVVNPAKGTVCQQAARLLQHFVTDRPRLNLVILSDYLRCGPRWYLKTLPHMMEYPTLGRAASLAERYAHAGLPSPKVLVVRGAQDTIAPHGWAALLTDTVPNGELLEVPGHQHVVQFFGAAEVAAGLLALAQRNPAAR